MATEHEEDGDRVAPSIDCVESARSRVVDERVLGGKAVYDSSRLDSTFSARGVGAGKREPAVGPLCEHLDLISGRGVGLNEDVVPRTNPQMVARASVARGGGGRSAGYDWRSSERQRRERERGDGQSG